MSERPIRWTAPLVALAALLGAGGARTLCPPAHEIASNDATYRVVYETAPAEVPLNEPFAINVRSLSADGERLPVQDVELHFDARMPEHRHGMRVRPEVLRLGDGHFRVEGALLHMPGTWELHFDLTRGPITERAQARVELE